MKLTSIGVFSSNGDEVATLSFRDPGSLNPFIAKNIIGLDADEIVPRFYGISINSKDKYYSMSLNPRDIILSVLLNPDFTMDKTYSDLRDELYRAISSSRTGLITLKFYYGMEEIAYISGFVTKMESPHFTEQPEVQITLKCDDPMLRGSRIIENPIAQSAAHAPTIVDLSSTAPHGFSFKLTFTADTSYFHMQDSIAAEWAFIVTPGVINGVTGFKVGDQLFFSSEHTGRDLYMIRAGETIYLADKIQPGSIWPILFPSVNMFVNTAGITWNYIRYYEAYWGV